MKFKSLLTIGFCAAIFSQAHAAVSYSGTTYTQSFDATNGVTTWSNNSTLAGWYAATTATASITTIGANTGSTSTEGLYSFGVAGTNAVTERSLGFVASNSFTGSNGSGEGFLGLELVNGTGNSLTSFSLSYDGEQWTRNNSGAQTIAVQYSLNATSLTTGTWTTAGAGLTFTSPQTGNPSVVLDGNASANRANRSGTVSSINWTSGSTLWIRFVDLNDAGNNDLTLAIDNVSFTAVPEPASALLGALGLLGLVRRRR